MKRILTLGLGLAMTATVAAQDKVIALTAPDMARPATLMQALSSRHSDRAFAPGALKPADLSDLLWAANGINRPAEGKRTAPSAMNRQEVDIYVATAEGAYRYDAAGQRLVLVTDRDLRPAVAAGQDFAATAPVCLILVADLSKLGDASSERTRLMGAADVGIVSQNVSLFCAAAGLSTVPRATMDTAALCEALGLSEAQLPVLNHPVGYPAEP